MAWAISFGRLYMVATTSDCLLNYHRGRSLSVKLMCATAHSLVMPVPSLDIGGGHKASLNIVNYMYECQANQLGGVGYLFPLLRDDYWLNSSIIVTGESQA